MNEGMKRLLRCDGISTIRDLGSMGPIAFFLVVWFLLIYGKVMNLLFVMIAMIGLLIMSSGVRDWQSQIGNYIGMGITRKSTFAVIVIRGLVQIFLGVILETVTAGICYPEYLKSEIILSGMFLFFFCNGWGQLSGGLYSCGKLGRIMQIAGLTVVGAFVGGGSMIAIQSEDVLDRMIRFIRMPVIAWMGIAAATMWIIGTLAAHRQMKTYTVI